MDARLGWLLLGCAIGFVAGYIVRSLREIKQKVDEVDEHVTKRIGRDDGLVRYPLLMDAVLLLVVVMTVWAAITSQINSNQVEKAQHKIDRTTKCTKSYLAQTISALNERTVYTKQSADANAALQNAQFQYLSIFLSKTPPTKAEAMAQFEKYYNSVKKFLDASKSASHKAQQFPFPKNNEFQNCIHQK